VKRLLAGLFAPFQSSPRRWLWVALLLLVILVLALSGSLR